jgi:glycosyltransferase involved in cell wall biosynthesis
MPAYNAAATLERTVAEVPGDIVDEVIVVDDASRDDTVAIARQLGLRTIRHDRNRGYGGNQKTCYATALSRQADVVVMVHPDYQYSPRLIAAMAAMIAYGEYDACIASRVLGGSAWASGMPRWKFVANRALTLAQNMLIGARLSEYHTGYRAYSRQALRSLPLATYSDDFVFDNQLLTDLLTGGFRVGEISCPSRYFAEASSINFRRSVRYGLGVLQTAFNARLALWGLRPSPLRAGGYRVPAEEGSVDPSILAEIGLDEEDVAAID